MLCIHTRVMQGHGVLIICCLFNCLSGHLLSCQATIKNQNNSSICEHCNIASSGGPYPNMWRMFKCFFLVMFTESQINRPSITWHLFTMWWRYHFFWFHSSWASFQWQFVCHGHCPLLHPIPEASEHLVPSQGLMPLHPKGLGSCPGCAQARTSDTWQFLSLCWTAGNQWHVVALV